ncbi:uncharacterized protein [Gossypium hirsutum]|uniref:Reverse transcriptase domain-containing protein n=1 Tax=Gossypium hirsutum TaxID=3635 RepID=A0ABM2YHR7_GOSHI|nr:uncharacterized protein LOC121203715 [Gossypium hirsutum]
MEVLHLVLDKATEEELIKGFNDVILGIKFSHLQFANDTILFLEVDDKEVTNVMYILRVFEIFLGLSSNFNKSCLVGFDVEEELLFRMAAICKCKIGTLPFNYLGVPLGANLKRLHLGTNHRQSQEEVVGIEMSITFMAGRVVLINAALSSLPIYFMSLFQALVTVIKKN